MQQVQQREIPERMSWARAMIFGVGFFFLAAILVGQLPSYIFNLVTNSMVGLEQTTLALGAICLASFIIIQVIVLLFDPKPLVPPIIFSGLGAILTVGGLALPIWQGYGTQYSPTTSTSFLPVLGGKVLWFPPGSIDFVMLGVVILLVGVAMIFYSVLALREQSNPDRSDLGTSPAIRAMIIVAVMLLILFMVFYTLVNDQGLAYVINPGAPLQTQVIIDTILDCVLGLAIFLTLGAFALRLHYLMRPVRKRTMSSLYAFGALGLALVALLLWGAVWVLASIWTAVARREFAVVGENNLGCLGMWLVVGTCLLIYLAAFAFFSIPVFPNETAPNVPFISGTIIPPHVAPGQPPVLAQPDAVVMLFILGAIAAIQFFFLIRNRYKV